MGLHLAIGAAIAWLAPSLGNGGMLARPGGFALAVLALAATLFVTSYVVPYYWLPRLYRLRDS
jgi:hypothetical protein